MRKITLSVPADWFNILEQKLSEKLKFHSESHNNGRKLKFIKVQKCDDHCKLEEATNGNDILNKKLIDRKSILKYCSDLKSSIKEDKPFFPGKEIEELFKKSF